MHTHESIDFRGFSERIRVFKSMTASDVDKIVAFAEGQYCRWHVKWLFSPATSPNAIAAKQAEAWKAIYNMFGKQLISAVPDVEPLLSRRLRVQLAEHAMRSKAEYDDANSASRALAGPRMFVARFLNNIGLRTAAERTVHKALYPPGTVGWAEEIVEN
jgi:hypothetical protein